jgi:hypothetical protein
MAKRKAVASGNEQKQPDQLPQKPAPKSPKKTGTKKVVEALKDGAIKEAAQTIEAAEKTLTLKRERFVNAYLETGNQTEAYRRSYNCQNMSQHAIEVEASRLMKNPEVSLRIRLARESERADSLLTLEDHMSQLKNLRDASVTLGQLSAAIKAEELRGKLRGFYVEKVEHGSKNEFSQMSDEELHKFIAEEARALGINLSKSRH